MRHSVNHVFLHFVSNKMNHKPSYFRKIFGTSFQNLIACPIVSMARKQTRLIFVVQSSYGPNLLKTQYFRFVNTIKFNAAIMVAKLDDH